MFLLTVQIAASDRLKVPNFSRIRFTIDKGLKRYESALRHLCRCQPVRAQDIIAYMNLHRRYIAALEEFCQPGAAQDWSEDEGVSQVVQAAAGSQADLLTWRGKHEEAGYLYQRVGLYDRAMSSFRQCASWTNCLSMASLAGVDHVRFRVLVGDLVKALRSRSKYSDAAHLCQYYLQDYCMAAQCFMEGLHLSEAWGLVLRYDLADMKESLVKCLQEAHQMVYDRLDWSNCKMKWTATRVGC